MIYNSFPLDAFVALFKLCYGGEASFANKWAKNARFQCNEITSPTIFFQHDATLSVFMQSLGDEPERPPCVYQD